MLFDALNGNPLNPLPDLGDSQLMATFANVVSR
jgi:hypothetical protein